MYITLRKTIFQIQFDENTFDLNNVKGYIFYIFILQGCLHQKQVIYLIHIYIFHSLWPLEQAVLYGT